MLTDPCVDHIDNTVTRVVPCGLHLQKQRLRSRSRSRGWGRKPKVVASRPARLQLRPLPPSALSIFFLSPRPRCRKTRSLQLLLWTRLLSHASGMHVKHVGARKSSVRRKDQLVNIFRPDQSRADRLRCLLDLLVPCTPQSTVCVAARRARRSTEKSEQTVRTQ